MRTLIRSGTLALTAALLSTAAHAGDRWPYWYVGLSGSVGFLQDSDVSGNGAGTSREITHDIGWGAGAALGYMPRTAMAPFNYMRFEGEVYYHTNTNDERKTTGASAPSGGSMTTVSYMANAYYDFPTNASYMPYIGAGLGAAEVSLSSGSGIGNTRDDDTVFAYQFMAGLGFTPASMPDTQWTVGYRYLGMSDPSFRTSTGAADVDYNLHSVEAGMKFRF